MIDAYIAGGTNAQRVTITLEESGLPYQVKKPNFQAGDTKTITVRTCGDPNVSVARSCRSTR